MITALLLGVLTTESVGYRTRCAYDQIGNLFPVTDAREKTTSFSYDEDSNPRG